jgi:hypothetical protein
LRVRTAAGIGGEPAASLEPAAGRLATIAIAKGELTMTDAKDFDTECTAFIRGKERYVFLWRIGQQNEVFRYCGRFAANPELSLTWYDAAVIAARVREYLRQQGVEP